MYCVKCGVKLADTEKACPLCGTPAYIPEQMNDAAKPLFPQNKMPKATKRSKTLNGAIVVAFLIPILICFLSDNLISLTLFSCIANHLEIIIFRFVIGYYCQLIIS